MKKVKLTSEPVIIKNNDFKTIQIKVIFPFQRKEEEMVKANLIPNMLQLVCEDYPTEKEFSMAEESLFILNSFCGYNVLIDKGYFTFNMIIPEVDALGKDLLDEQFLFLSKIMYHPKLKDKHFCHEEFEREIMKMKMDIESAFQHPESYADIKSREVLDPDGIISNTIFNHQELIDLVNEENLYEFYLDKIYNNDPFIFIFGNVNEKRIKELCHKYLYLRDVVESVYEVDTHCYLPITDKVKDVVEKSNFRNSVYIEYYKVRDMKEEDKVLLDSVQKMLSSNSTRLLSKSLRNESELVYAVFAKNYNRYGVLQVIAYINKDNYQMTKDKIREVFTKLKDDEIISSSLEKIKEKARISLIRQLDNKVYTFSDGIIKNLKIDYCSSEYYEMLKKITEKDLKDFIDRLVLDTQYFLEEGSHESN